MPNQNVTVTVNANELAILVGNAIKFKHQCIEADTFEEHCFFGHKYADTVDNLIALGIPMPCPNHMRTGARPY